MHPGHCSGSAACAAPSLSPMRTVTVFLLGVAAGVFVAMTSKAVQAELAAQAAARLPDNPDAARVASKMRAMGVDVPG